MKNKIIFVAISLCLLMAYCVAKTGRSIDKSVDGDIIILGKDTFDIFVDTHRVVSSERIPPRNVMEEGSPVWLNRTHLDSTFKTSSPRPIGSTQVYKIAKKRK